MSLKERILSTTAEVGVIGLGYVGLTEALELARAGFQVTGFDIDPVRVQAVMTGRSYLVDIADEDLSGAVKTGRLTATQDLDLLARMDAILICVPTPLSKTKSPDLSYIVSAVEAIRLRLRVGPAHGPREHDLSGHDEEVVRPALEGDRSAASGSDFFLAFSPERVDPGDREFTTDEHPEGRRAA